jgi:hypothetical protein
MRLYDSKLQVKAVVTPSKSSSPASLATPPDVAPLFFPDSCRSRDGTTGTGPASASHRRRRRPAGCQRSASVPSQPRPQRVVQPGLADSGLAQQGLPGGEVAPEVQGLAVGLGEHPVAVMPFAARVLAFALLGLAVLGDQRVELVGRA